MEIEARAAPEVIPRAPSLDPESNKKEQIVREAIRLFCEKGYEATSVRMIVEAVGVSKPVLYYYFKNKEELFRHIIESSLGPFEEEQNAICSDTQRDLWDKLQALVDLHIEGALEEPDRVRFLHSIFFSGLYKNVFDFEARWELHFKVVVDLFQRAIQEGAIGGRMSADTLASCFIGVAHEAMRSRVYCPGLVGQPATSEEVVSIFKRGVA
jgi:AcrR family transcriptional regulator